MRALRISLILLALWLSACTPPPGPPARSPGALRVASHNVHFIRMTEPRGPWSLADWEARKQALDAVFKEVDADLVAFQEMVSIGPDANRDVNLARDWLLSSARIMRWLNRSFAALFCALAGRLALERA